MSVILNIDTATDMASVVIARDGKVTGALFNQEQKDHAGFLQPAIQILLLEAFLTIQDLDAIAVAAGPGSYTGLRVGMASAKGLCYALKKPLITLGTLDILAAAAIQQVTDTGVDTLFCPMIDARRMEVFTGLFNRDMKSLMEPQAMTLDEQSFHNNLLKNNICFFGTGAAKWASISRHVNAVFVQVENNTLAMSYLAEQKFKNNDFANLAYSEPFYLKEFFSPATKTPTPAKGFS